MSLEQTEKECAANAVAPRVSLADIEAAIDAKFFINGDSMLPIGGQYHSTLRALTICLLVMKNGFVVIGKSAPASAENFNRKLGQKLAYEDAVRQLWPLMGFALRDKLAGV